MKILVACEFSGIVREAFKAKGHDSWSCDLLPTEIEGQHLVGDVLETLNDGWDLMIAHPPCTYLSYVGMRHWNNRGRLESRLKALNFFAQLWLSPIKKICIENPRGCASPVIAKYSQTIEPYYFGDTERKATCLWLKNLHKLKHYAIDGLFDEKTHAKIPQPHYKLKTTGKAIHFTEKIKDPKTRSKTFVGIANAMAEQWG